MTKPDCVVPHADFKKRKEQQLSKKTLQQPAFDSISQRAQWILAQSQYRELTGEERDTLDRWLRDTTV